MARVACFMDLRVAAGADVSRLHVGRRALDKVGAICAPCLGPHSLSPPPLWRPCAVPGLRPLSLPVEWVPVVLRDNRRVTGVEYPIWGAPGGGYPLPTDIAVMTQSPRYGGLLLEAKATMTADYTLKPMWRDLVEGASPGRIAVWEQNPSAVARAAYTLCAPTLGATYPRAGLPPGPSPGYGRVRPIATGGTGGLR